MLKTEACCFSDSYDQKRTSKDKSLSPRRLQKNTIIFALFVVFFGVFQPQMRDETAWDGTADAPWAMGPHGTACYNAKHLGIVASSDFTLDSRWVCFDTPTKTFTFDT